MHLCLSITHLSLFTTHLSLSIKLSPIPSLSLSHTHRLCRKCINHHSEQRHSNPHMHPYTEGTATFAPPHHDGGSGCPVFPPSPALPDVGAPCLLAHSVQVQLAEGLLQTSVLPPLGDVRLEPFWEP